MAIEDWSEHITIAHLGEPGLNDDLDTLQTRMERTPVDVVLNLSAVRFINSSNIGRLLKLRQSSSAAGRRLVLCGADAQVWGAFLVSGLDKIFEFADAVPLALASLQLARESGTA